MGMMALVSVKDALLNVVTGMVVVFLVLILISYIIDAFKLISVVQNKLEARKAKNTALKDSTDNTVAQIEEKEETVSTEDDLELVAVITAAVAASMGTSTDGFVVRSIRRAGKSNWKNA